MANYVCKLLVLVRVGDDFRFRSNSKLYELLNYMDIVQRINIQRLCWLGYIVRMDENVSVKRVFDTRICGSRGRGRPGLLWMDHLVKMLSLIGVTNWLEIR